MPVFFEMHSTVEPLMRRRNADALAEILQDSRSYNACAPTGA
jgi:hypothetical protein